MPSGHKIDWSLYDKIIIDELPHTTTHEFARRLGLHIKAIRRRARQLGIKPLPYHITDEQRAKLSRSLKRTQWSIATDDLLLANADVLSLKELEALLHIDDTAIWRRLRELGHIHDERSTKEKHRRRNIEALSRPERRAQLSKQAKGKKLSPEHKQKLAEARRKQSGRLSKIQQALYDIAESLQLVCHKETSAECHIGPWTFDAMVVAKDGQRTLIEVQGGWVHSQEKNIVKDTAKATYIAEYFPHLRLEYIWEAEFGSPNKVRDRLLTIVGAVNQEQVEFDLHDVRIGVGDLDESRQFLTAYHYLGGMRGKSVFSAYHEGTIIATAIFSAPTRAEIATRLGVAIYECLELRRLVIKPTHNKKNFASYFLSRVVKFVPPRTKVLVTFADPVFGHHGTVYSASGWKFDGESEPSYFYIGNGNYVMHKKTLSERANSVHMTEAEYAATHNWSKIPTPPKLRYIMWLDGKMS